MNSQADTLNWVKPREWWFEIDCLLSRNHLAAS